MKWLVDDVRKWYRMATVRFWIIVGVGAQIAEALPAVTREMLSPEAANAISIIAAISIGLRLWKQNGVSGAKLPVDGG